MTRNYDGKALSLPAGPRDARTYSSELNASRPQTESPVFASHPRADLLSPFNVIRKQD